MVAPRRFALLGHQHNLADLVGDSDDITEGTTNLFFTDERAQDAVGSILVDTASIDFTYSDATPSITAAVLPAGVNHNALANLTVGDPHTQYVLDSDLTESTQDIVGAMFTDSPTIDFTYDDTAGTETAIVIDDSISNTKLANMIQATVKGRAAAAGTGDPTDLTAAQVATIVNSSLDHGSLLGLSDDDHPQYPLAAGTETISGAWTHTTQLVISGITAGGSSAGVQMSSNAPAFGFRELDAGADTKQWDFIASSNAFLFRGISDDNSAVSNGLRLTRSGTTITSVDLPNDNHALRIGASADLTLTHDGTNSIIENDTGNLVFRVNGDAFFNEGGIVTGAEAAMVGSRGLELLGVGGASFMSAVRFGANANPATFELLKSRNASVGSHTIVNSGDTVGAITAYGSNGTAFDNLASIQFVVDGAPGASTDMPGRIVFYTTPDASVTLTERLRIDSAGRIGGLALHNNAAAPSGVAIQYIASGTYTPTLTNVANLAASTARQCQWMRVGNVVTVTGQVDVDPTLTATATELGISLPIASALTTAFQCGGSAFASAIAAQGAAIDADATNDRAHMRWVAGDVTNQPMMFSFSYEVL